MTEKVIKNFQKKIWEFYQKNRREFPWRDTNDPYKILVSEMMLQQTQTSRVLPKYESFLQKFPTVQSLTNAALENVLREWSGLGYNRRAVFIKKSADVIVTQYNGVVPQTVDELVNLPGIGINTAGAIVAFAHERSVVFIETNIRRVYIHEFFSDRSDVSDKEILELIRDTLPDENIRNWYYALMDYGVFLAKQRENPNKKSKHYTIQSKFEGSRRKLRGHILRVMLEKKRADFDDFQLDNYDKDYIQDTVNDMLKEGIIREEDKTFTIS